MRFVRAMAYVFEITVSASLEDGELLTRILDFKEDLHRECFRADYVSVSDPAAVDSALMPVSFSVKFQKRFGSIHEANQKVAGSASS